MLPEPSLIGYNGSRSLVSTFVTTLKNYAEKIRLEMSLIFHDMGQTIKRKLERVRAVINKKRGTTACSLDLEGKTLIETDNEHNETIADSTQFQLTQENKSIELQDQLQRYVNTLPVFGFNSAKYDLNLIKPYLVPVLVNEKELQPAVVKTANQFVSFKFDNIQDLDITNFLGGATSLDSFLKAYKMNEIKNFSPYEWFDCAEKLSHQSLPAYDDFFSQLRNCNPLDDSFSDYQNPKNAECDTEKAVRKFKFLEIPPTDQENYVYLQQAWNINHMQFFQDFLAGTIMKM